MRRLVYVSGSPGAGKTSLAAPLAAELGYALLTKDLIKETLHDALGALGGRPVEVHCACPTELAATRYNTRTRHPVHHMTHASVEALAEWDRPVGIGTLVTVDTTAAVDVAAVAAQVRRHHAATD